MKHVKSNNISLCKNLSSFIKILLLFCFERTLLTNNFEQFALYHYYGSSLKLKDISKWSKYLVCIYCLVLGRDSAGLSEHMRKDTYVRVCVREITWRACLVSACLLDSISPSTRERKEKKEGERRLSLISALFADSLKIKLIVIKNLLDIMKAHDFCKWINFFFS